MRTPYGWSGEATRYLRKFQGQTLAMYVCPDKNPQQEGGAAAVATENQSQVDKSQSWEEKDHILDDQDCEEFRPVPEPRVPSVVLFHSDDSR